MKIVGLKSKKRDGAQQQLKAPPMSSSPDSLGFTAAMQMQNEQSPSATASGGSGTSVINLTSQVDSQHQTLCLPISSDPQASNRTIAYSSVGQLPLATTDTSHLSPVADRNQLYGLLALAMNQIQHQQNQSQSLATFASTLMGNNQDPNIRSLQVGNDVSIVQGVNVPVTDGKFATSRQQLSSSNTGSDNTTFPALTFPAEDAQEQDTELVGFLSDVGLVGMGGNDTSDLSGNLPQRVIPTTQNMSLASNAPTMQMTMPGVASLSQNNGLLQQQYASFIQQMMNYQQQYQQQVQAPLYQSSSLSMPTLLPYQNNMQLTQLPWSHNPEMALQLQQQQSLLLSHQSFLDEARLSQNQQPQLQYVDTSNDTTAPQQQLPGQDHSDVPQDDIRHQR
jgi:hypothetical protein